ncbi:hypothetical protein [Caballeronia glebae]|uniref:hypothetical protein n=1 Tax=Caballeronia glebae TaxID=1777143 RepID=UPI0038BAB079
MYEIRPLHIVGVSARRRDAGCSSDAAFLSVAQANVCPLAGTRAGKVNAMEFVLLLAIFLTSSGYLFKASMPPTPPTANASAPPTANPAATESLSEKKATLH